MLQYFTRLIKDVMSSQDKDTSGYDLVLAQVLDNIQTKALWNAVSRSYSRMLFNRNTNDVRHGVPQDSSGDLFDWLNKQTEMESNGSSCGIQRKEEAVP